MKRLFLKISASCVLASLGSTASAQFEANRLWLNTGFYSAHFDSNKGLRNANPGLGIEYKLNPD